MSYGQYNVLGDTAPSPSDLPLGHCITLLFSFDFLFMLSKVTSLADFSYQECRTK